jgi:hypothetical protein
VPLTSDPNQTFELPLNIDGTRKSFFVNLRFNEAAQYWVMTIRDLTGKVVLDSVPLVTGNAPAGNLLRQFGYLLLGSAYILNASGTTSPDYPNSSDLGTDYVLLWDNTQQ